MGTVIQLLSPSRNFVVTTEEPKATLEAAAFLRFVKENPDTIALTSGYVHAARHRFEQLKDVTAEEILAVLQSPRLNMAGLTLASKIYSADLTFELVGYSYIDIELNWNEAKKSL